MKKTTSFRWVMMGMVLGIAPAFSQIPDSIWRTNDTGYFDMWNKRNLDTTVFWAHSNNWSVANPGTDSAKITTDGLAPNGITSGNWTDLVWKFQMAPTQPNFEIRFSWHMPVNPNGNAGLNARGHCGTGTIATLCGGLASGYRLYGPKISVGPTETGNIWNSGASSYANGIATCKLGTSTAWQDLAYRVKNDTARMLYYQNGFAAGNPIQCSSYKYTAVSDVAATSPGLMALQYETARISEFKNIKIHNLNAVQTTAVRRVDRSLPLVVEGGRKSLLLNVTSEGTYSIQISDLMGRNIKSIRGLGSSLSLRLFMPQAGLYLVKISSANGTQFQKVYVH